MTTYTEADVLRLTREAIERHEAERAEKDEASRPGPADRRLIAHDDIENAMRALAEWGDTPYGRDAIEALAIAQRNIAHLLPDGGYE